MNVPKTNPVKTVLTISIGFLVVFVITELKWAVYTSLIIGILGLLSSRLSVAIDYLWMKLAKLLSFIIPNILLSIVFYFFLFPVALLAKISRKEDVLKLKGKGKTIWVDRSGELDKASFEKMW